MLSAAGRDLPLSFKGPFYACMKLCFDPVSSDGTQLQSFSYLQARHEHKHPKVITVAPFRTGPA